MPYRLVTPQFSETANAAIRQCISDRFYCCVLQIRYKMIVTPAQAGVQFKDAWIPACAGMTDSYHTSELNNILGNSSGTQHLKLFQKHF
jgi:hypothetical protein